MKKTKIAFEDIKAGDLLEIVTSDCGVKIVATGIAFAQDVFDAGRGEPEVHWITSERGLVVAKSEGAAIYRIDVAEVKFEDA